MRTCPKHVRYTKDCDGCRDRNSQEKRERRRRLRGTPVPEGMHGREGTYDDYGCHCGMCSYAKRDAQQKRASRQRILNEVA